MKPARFTKRFVRQLHSQYDYVCAENPAAAERVKQRVLAAVCVLGTLSGIGECVEASRHAGTGSSRLAIRPHLLRGRISCGGAGSLAFSPGSRRCPLSPSAWYIRQESAAAGALSGEKGAEHRRQD